MGDLSWNFSRAEFACKCGCGQDTVDSALLTRLQDMVDYFALETEKPIRVIITSGNRCPRHNQDVGGAKNSWHISGRAADFVVQMRDGVEWKALHPEVVGKYLMDTYDRDVGIGIYKSWVHLDSRTGVKVTWRG